MCGGCAMRALLAACALAMAAATAAEDASQEPVLRVLRSPARYSATSSVLLSDADVRGGELGWRLRAELVVRPLWTHQQDVLLHFTLESPQLMLRGKHQNAEFLPRPSIWDSVPSSTFLALWSAGYITKAYLDPEDPPDILNFKKSLISLFQFQLAEGERNETDVSGACRAQYEALPDRVYRKIKHRCLWEGAWDSAEEGSEEAPGAERRRVMRYELSAARDALRAVTADEVVRLRAHDGAAPLKARALLALAWQRAAPRDPAAPPADLARALELHPRLADHALPLRARDRFPDPSEEQSLAAAVAAQRAALEPERAGSADAAAAALRLLPALRRAPRDTLLALLHDPASEPLLEGLARALGLAGTAAAHAAAREALQLAAREPPRPALAREYWAALALAPAVDEGVLLDALRLGDAEGGAAEGGALLAAAAAAAAGPDRLQLAVKQALTKGLARCKEEACRAVRLQALGALRRADCASLLLQHASRPARAPALAALHALALLPPAALRGPPRRRLERVALALDHPHALEARAAALQLALRAAAPHPAALRPLAAALRARAPRELRRVAWQTLLALAEDHPALRRELPALDPRPADWLRRAYDGTSSVLSRSARWARLESVQLAARGVLRRGSVTLHALRRPLLAVEMWTRGLESLAAAEPELPPGAREPGDEPGPEPGDDAVEGGLALTVAGARRPDVVLFSGQGELLGHIWAGTGSEPTAVLRAALPAAELRATLALHAGVLLDARARAAVALAMDAQAAVSLWGRTARAGLTLRGAGAALSSLRARTAWGAVSARAQAAAEPALSLAASLDFYAAPQLCVHTTPEDYTYRLNVTLQSEQGARAWRVRRERVRAWAAPGRTLALGARNDAACRTLGLAHLD